jgi:hypothetical protein
MNRRLRPEWSFKVNADGVPSKVNTGCILGLDTKQLHCAIEGRRFSPSDESVPSTSLFPQKLDRLKHIVEVRLRWR